MANDIPTTYTSLNRQSFKMLLVIKLFILQDMSHKSSVPSLVLEPYGYLNSSPWFKACLVVEQIAYGSTLS